MMTHIYTHTITSVNMDYAPLHFSHKPVHAMRYRMINRAVWVRGLRRQLGVNQARFAEMLGVAQPTVSRWEKGAEPEIAHWDALRALATAYNYGHIDERAVLTVPLIGFVSAGAAVNLYAEGQGPLDEVEMPPGGSEHTVAVEVRGDSMTGVADDQYIIYYDDRRDAVHEGLYGKLCVVGLANNTVLVKKLAPGRQLGRYDLYSTSGAPLFDQEVVWAAKVEWIKPR
ncbi:MAG: helix-turn-helix domain-containing protein [Armatimonadia bacterium]